MTSHARARSASRRRSEGGSAIIETVWLGVLLLVPVVWVLLCVFEVQRGAFALHAATRAAGRAYALAPDDATGHDRAKKIARMTLDDQGSADMPLEVEVSCTTEPSCHVGTSVITVRIVSGVDLPLLPEFLQRGPAGFTLESSHTVPVGRYVSGGAP